MRTSLHDVPPSPRKGARNIDHVDHINQAGGAHAGQASTGTARSSQRTAALWRLALVGLVFIPVMLACTNTVSLDSAPASSLTVSVQFENALVPGVNVDVSVRPENNKGDVVELTGGQTYSIDGVKIPASGHVTIPRQPSGAANFYTLTYTDEHGKQTSAHIAAPQTDFAILYPDANGNVPLPKPLNSPNKQPVPTPTANQPRPPQLAASPLIVNYTLPYPINSLPQDPAAVAAGQRNFYTVDARVSAQCAHGWPQCTGFLPSDAVNDTVTADGFIRIGDSGTPWGEGFEAYTPGYAKITAVMRVVWTMPATGFHLFTVGFINNAVNVPINLV